MKLTCFYCSRSLRTARILSTRNLPVVISRLPACSFGSAAGDFRWRRVGPFLKGGDYLLETGVARKPWTAALLPNTPSRPASAP